MEERCWEVEEQACASQDGKVFKDYFKYEIDLYSVNPGNIQRDTFKLHNFVKRDRAKNGKIVKYF